MTMTRRELAKRFAEADRVRRMLRRATVDLQEFGRRLLEAGAERATAERNGHPGPGRSGHRGDPRG